MIKLIERDGKEFFGTYGGGLIEASMDNVEILLDTHRRILDDIEDAYKKQEREILRLNRIKEFIIRKKYRSSNLNKTKEDTHTP